MARRRCTQEIYDSMVVAYMQKPGNYSNAAKAAGTSTVMAKTGWNKGWPLTSLTFRAIKDVYKEYEAAHKEEDQRKADRITRRVLAREDREDRHEAAERERDVDTAKETRTEEEMLVQLSRATTLSILGGLGQMAVGMNRLGERMGRALENIDEVNPAVSMEIFKGVAAAMRSAVMAANQAVDLQRKIGVDPATVPGSTPDQGEIDSKLRDEFRVKTYPELESEIKKAAQALERAKDRGLFVVPDADEEDGEDASGVEREDAKLTAG